MNDWINKKWYIHTMEYYLDISKIHISICNNIYLESMLSKISQMEKDKNHLIFLIVGMENRNQ